MIKGGGLNIDDVINRIRYIDLNQLSADELRQRAYDVLDTLRMRTIEESEHILRQNPEVLNLLVSMYEQNIEATQRLPPPPCLLPDNLRQLGLSDLEIIELEQEYSN